MRHGKKVAAVGTHVCGQNNSDHSNSAEPELHGARSKQRLLLKTDNIVADCGYIICVSRRPASHLLWQTTPTIAAEKVKCRTTSGGVLNDGEGAKLHMLMQCISNNRSRGKQMQRAADRQQIRWGKLVQKQEQKQLQQKHLGEFELPACVSLQCEGFCARDGVGPTLPALMHKVDSLLRRHPLPQPRGGQNLSQPRQICVTAQTVVMRHSCW